jgi:hypothetical protein
MKVFDEIKDTAPTLINYGEKLSTDVPKDYFMSLQDQLWERLGLPDESIPEHYLVSLQAEVMEDVSRIKRNTWKRFIPSIAASIAVLIIALLVIGNEEVKPDSLDIEPELAFYYLENNLDNWHLATFAEYEIIEQEDLIDTYSIDDGLSYEYLESLQADGIDMELLELLEQ